MEEDTLGEWLVSDEELGFTEDEWYEITFEAQDLVEQMLLKCPEERIGIDQILRNDWLTEMSVSS